VGGGGGVWGGGGGGWCGGGGCGVGVGGGGGGAPLNRVWNCHVIKYKPKVYNNSGFYRHSSLALIFRYEYEPRQRRKWHLKQKHYLTLLLKPLEKHINLETPVYREEMSLGAKHEYL